MILPSTSGFDMPLLAAYPLAAIKAGVNRCGWALAARGRAMGRAERTAQRAL